jgi:hypothetical protein
LIVALAGPVSFDSLTNAIVQNLSEASASRNLEAVRYGAEQASRVLGKRIQPV